MSSVVLNMQAGIQQGLKQDWHCSWSDNFWTQKAKLNIHLEIVQVSCFMATTTQHLEISVSIKCGYGGIWLIPLLLLFGKRPKTRASRFGQIKGLMMILFSILSVTWQCVYNNGPLYCFLRCLDIWKNASRVSFHHLLSNLFLMIMRV